MKLAFAGTPAFAQVALQALLDAGYDVVLVLTQPDRPHGRGLKVKPSEVKTLAVQRGLQVYQPASLKLPEAARPLADSGAAVLVVAAYGLILPQFVLDLFPLGCINIHASLLPRWRGAAPIQRAILAGDRETGISIMRMEAGLDSGPVLLQERTPIGTLETSQSLHDRLAALGGSCIVRALALMQSGSLVPQPQPSEGVCYAHKINKAEAEIDWHRSAEELDRQIRAFDPFPGATTSIRQEPLKIWRATPLPEPAGTPGTIVSTGRGLIVCCGSGALALEEVQRPGGRRISAQEFLRGFAVAPGDAFGS